MGFLSPRAGLVPLVLMVFATGALAQGVVDQQNDPSGSSGFGCGSPPILNGTVLQSFVPAADNLVAVELRLLVGSAFPSGGSTTTAQIRDGSSSGTVLGTASTSLAGPMAQGTQIIVRFDFSQIALTPGNTYLIEWVTPPTTELMWLGQGNDPYPAGTAYSCSGNPWPVTGTDFNFITYAAAPEANPTTEETPSSDCEAILERMRDAVADLELKKFKSRALDRLLANAEKHLGKGKAKAAAANVLCVERNVAFLARLGFISEDDAAAILELGEEFRACLGVESHARWHSWQWKRHDHHD